MATFAWDLLNCIPPVAITIILFAAFQIEQYNGINLVAVLLLLVSQCGSGRVFAVCVCVRACVRVCMRVCMHACVASILPCVPHHMLTYLRTHIYNFSFLLCNFH